MGKLSIRYDRDRPDEKLEAQLIGVMAVFGYGLQGCGFHTIDKVRDLQFEKLNKGDKK